MSFVNEAKKLSAAKETENGGMAYTTTGKACIDLFAILGSMREYDDTTIINKYMAARNENEELADRMVLYARDTREGLGERRVGKILLKKLADIAPQKVINNFDKIAELGRWDDFYCFENTQVEPEMWSFLQKTLTKDMNNYLSNKPITLLAKWLKSVNASSIETKRLGRKTAREFGISESKYRKILAKLRAYENVVEVKMSANKFNEINFEQVPSVAMKRYKNAFKKQSTAFQEYITKLVKGEAKVNAGALYPYDLVEQYMNYRCYKSNPITEAQWKSLPNFVEGNKNVIVMADVSGSMEGRPMATSVGLAIYFAERNTGTYQNLYMSYTDVPHFITIDPNKTLFDNVKFVQRAGVGFNTNLDGALKAVFDVAVKTQDVPEALVIISDNEIDYFWRNNNADDIVTKWQNKYDKVGLEMPKLIFWDVASRNDGTYLGRSENFKVSFCSGQSASTFQHLTALIEKSAWDAMVDILMQERYNFK